MSAMRLRLTGSAIAWGMLTAFFCTGAASGSDSPKGPPPAQRTVDPVTLNSEPINPAPAVAVRDGSATDRTRHDAGARRSRIVVIKPDGRSGRTTVALHAPDFADDENVPSMLCNGILARELVRQAVLVAARDELGLATRDGVLGDPPAPSRGRERVELGSLMTDSASLVSHAFVLRGGGERAERLLDVDLPRAYLPDGGITSLVEKAESLSRGEFLDLLRKLGAEGRRNVLKGDAEAKLPANVEARLSQLDFTTVFWAVRTLHETIKSDGESPSRLGALARGYALLGVLSEFQWHPAHKAFKARALLYAQRLVVREPGSAWALWNRAYARALVGLHGDAIADLKAAGKAGPQRPGWVDAIDALARHDATRLDSVKGPDAKLAALLRLLVVEYPTTSRRTLAAAREVVTVDPLCFRGQDALCRVGGVANGHTATELGPEVFTTVLPDRLKAIPALPPRVREHLNHPTGGDSALFEAFQTAGATADDAGEPSWSVLGHLLRETRFLQVFRRLHFMRMVWSVPVDEYWNESHLAVNGHRFYPVLEILAEPPGDSVSRHAAFFEGLLRQELEPVEVILDRLLQPTRNRNAIRMWRNALRHMDHVRRDLCEGIENDFPPQKVLFARELLQVCPEDTYAMAALIEHDWKNSAARAAEWEKKAGDSPQILAAFARLYTGQKKPEEAERYLTRYVKQEPDCWAFRMLAVNYKARGDLKRWQETLEKVLQQEDPGLEHAQARVQLANHFMEMGDWTRAKPYAEAAAETWAGWAMECAQRCAEGMNDWPLAEQWAQRQSDRYPQQSLFTWYLFCQRTGHGDTKGARDFTDAYLQANGGIQAADLTTQGYYAWLNGDLKESLRLLKQAYARGAGSNPCIEVIMAADELGDAATRDEYRKILLTKHRNDGPKTVRIVELLPDMVKAGASNPPDTKAVDEVLRTIPEERQGLAGDIIGLYLKNRGKAAEARRYLERCAATPSPHIFRRAVAGKAARGLR